MTSEEKIDRTWTWGDSLFTCFVGKNVGERVEFAEGVAQPIKEGDFVAIGEFNSSDWKKEREKNEGARATEFLTGRAVKLRCVFRGTDTIDFSFGVPRTSKFGRVVFEIIGAVVAFRFLPREE